MLSETLDGLLSNIATAISLPLAVAVFWQSKKKEQIDREYGTYDALDVRYREFLLTCLENLDLGVYGAPEDFNEELLDSQKKQKREILLLMLISIFERAYLMYKRQSAPMKRQWSGWEKYMDDYCRSPSFTRDWGRLGSQFEEEFVRFMNARLREVHADHSKGVEKQRKAAP